MYLVNEYKLPNFKNYFSFLFSIFISLSLNFNCLESIFFRVLTLRNYFCNMSEHFLPKVQQSITGRTL